MHVEQQPAPRIPAASAGIRDELRSLAAPASIKRLRPVLPVIAICLLAFLPHARAEDAQQVVIPFDFQSKFDNGRYGAMVGDMVWKMLQREKGFIIPDSMQDVRDVCQAKDLHLAPDTPLDQVKRIMRDDFDASIGIWGSLERVPGTTGDAYDLSIRCVDFSVEPQPKVIYEITNVRTKTVSEIPHLYVKQMLDKLYQRTPGAPAPADPTAEDNWAKNPNLIPGGDFETATAGVPKDWEARAGQLREPLGDLVRWLPEAGNSPNHVIRFSFPKNVGDNEGVMYYSKPFPVEAGATYRFQCRWRTNGPAVKVFIKCYDETGTKYASDSPTETSPYERREVYRSQQNLKGPQKTWNTHTEDFTPRHTRYTPRWGRVMLYAYLGAGDVEFDDIIVKQILPASPGQHNKTPRHSMESRVTVEQMEQNERRPRQTQDSQAPPRQ